MSDTKDQELVPPPVAACYWKFPAFFLFEHSFTWFEIPYKSVGYQGVFWCLFSSLSLWINRFFRQKLCAKKNSPRNNSATDRGKSPVSKLYVSREFLVCFLVVKVLLDLRFQCDLQVLTSVEVSRVCSSGLKLQHHLEYSKHWHETKTIVITEQSYNTAALWIGFYNFNWLSFQQFERES